MTTEIEVIEKIDETVKAEIPKMYKVLIHNDNSTTFEFVILVLMRIFHKTMAQAIEITQAVHETQVGIAGAPYTREIAEEKTLETISFARANGFPLTTSFEEL